MNYHVLHFIAFVRLWWHFRHDAWNYCGPWEPVEVNTRFRRPSTDSTTANASVTNITIEYRQ